MQIIKEYIRDSVWRTNNKILHWTPTSTIRENNNSYMIESWI